MENRVIEDPPIQLNAINFFFFEIVPKLVLTKTDFIANIVAYLNSCLLNFTYLDNYLLGYLLGAYYKFTTHYTLCNNLQTCEQLTYWLRTYSVYKDLLTTC